MTFNLVVVEDDEEIVRTFATNHDVEKNELEKLLDMYSLRGGVETSYRVKHMFGVKPERINTNSEYFSSSSPSASTTPVS